MAVIDYVGAASARLTGAAALIPAWISLQRYTFPYFTGGPLVLTVDTLRATLYPLLWIILAWLLLNPGTTRHFLYRREDWGWRVLLGALYAIAIPFIFLSATSGVRNNWLQFPWIADVLILAMPFVWFAFLMAFSLPGGYARNIADERDDAAEATVVKSDESRNQEADRLYAQELSLHGEGTREIELGDETREAWRQKVLTRQAEQNVAKQERRDMFRKRSIREGIGRMGLVLAVLAFVFAGLGVASQSPALSGTFTRYLPVIIGVVVVAAFIIFSVVMGARGRSPLGNAMRIISLVVISGLLFNFVLFPAADRGLAVIYADFVAEAVASIETAMANFGK